MNHRTFQNNKGNPHGQEPGENIKNTPYSDFDPDSGIIGLKNYLARHATLLHEKTPSDSSLQPISHEF